MRLNLKTKIWLTIFSIVLMFSFFTLYYFPRQQGNLLVKNYNTEIQSLANTVALGVKIAITEQNFEGVQTAMEFVKGDERLQFLSMLLYDTAWNPNHTRYVIKQKVFKTFPAGQHPNPDIASSDSVIVKKSPFSTDTMSGAILLGFNTREILRSKEKITFTSLLVSGVVSLIGILIGFWLARNISVPVLAIRDAARLVGEGNLNQKITHIQHDEIGELGKAFNKMTDDLGKTTKELNEKNVVLSRTNETLNHTLMELKSTQQQLIQSEKLASLGELTAGIAHEIQNPLNFVNNFSEVNVELIDELTQEITAGNNKEAVLIADNIKENEKKITHHGRRAEGIVKNMLQHSRRSSGVKEPTDINALTDEHIRLAYHGLRARDKSFNAMIKTEFDERLNIGKNGNGMISVVPEDMGRVILNLVTNAFYAVTEKKKQLGQQYEPTIFVSTKKIDLASGDHAIEIQVRDNGNGIPRSALDKIFQPFFTTKPAGQGTGLGLSMSYDIVTKGHGGTLKVETKEGEGTVFIIQIPVKLDNRLPKNAESI